MVSVGSENYTQLAANEAHLCFTTALYTLSPQITCVKADEGFTSSGQPRTSPGSIRRASPASRDRSPDAICSQDDRPDRPDIAGRLGATAHAHSEIGRRLGRENVRLT